MKDVPMSAFDKLNTSNSGLSAVDRIKAALISNANESGTQRGSLLPWLFGNDDSCSLNTLTQDSFNVSLNSFPDSVPVVQAFEIPERFKEITKSYKQVKGIDKLYDWQEECLNCPTILNRQNLLITMPTSAGKTLVAEILMLREILVHNRAVMLVLPYVSLVQEKVRGLVPLSLKFGFTVEEYAGGRGSFPPPVRRRRQSLYVATIEKASSLLNAFIDPSLHGGRKRSIGEIGLVIMDEVHMLGDGERGALLEGSLVKLRAGFPNAQLVAMSATVGNIPELASCFSAEVYERDYRPVPLYEYIFCNKELYKWVRNTKSLERVTTADKEFPGREKHPGLRQLNQSQLAQMKRLDPDDLVNIIGDIVMENKHCLVFCATRRSAESAASLIVKLLCVLGGGQGDRQLKSQRIALLSQMKAENEGQCCPILSKTIPMGVAYHHAGLMPDERFAVEQAYSEGLITILCCTSTLAAGVNLPARRVIIRSPFIGPTFLTSDRYRQMAGRAGRAKLDTLGQSIIMCQSRDMEKVCAMLAAPMAPCMSCLDLILPSLCLEMSCIGLGTSIEQICNVFTNFSLWQRQKKIEDEPLKHQLSEIIKNLISSGMMCSLDTENNDLSLKPTPLGRASMAANLTPQAAHSLLADLKQAQAMITLASPLYLLYLIIPADNVPDLLDSVDFSILSREINKLQQDSDVDALKLLHLSESYVARMCGTGSCTVSLSNRTGNTTKSVIPYGRLQLALALRAIWYGATYWDAASRLGLSRGAVYQLVSQSTSFAHAAHRFSAQISDLWPLADLMLSLNRRLIECPLSDLSELLTVPGVHLGRARQLSRAGYNTLSTLATSDPNLLCQQVKHLPRKTAKAIVEAAQVAVRENVRNLQDAVDSIVEDTLSAAVADTSISSMVK